MLIFEVQKDALCKLSDSQLEELIARLSEADLVSKGHSAASVSRSGSINSPDGGIDVRVDVPVEKLDTGFLARPNTIFQVKKKSMPKAEIRKEMCPGGILSPALSRQAEIGGSYIIVSLADDCSEPMRSDRLNAMRTTMDGDPNKGSIHLDFFDRSKLRQWLRQHPAVVLWVRDVLEQPVSGWQSYGKWSNPPSGSDDTLILEPGVSITLPTGRGDKLTIKESIKPMRELVRSTSRTVRIIGLSGVGKTRIVQSLFDETIGDDALDRTVAIYADSGECLNPSPTEMLNRLIGENHRAIMVLDNCSSCLHATLASKVTSANSQVTLITVEYDIREDNPQSTDVIRIVSDGPALAEKLLLQRFPSIHQENARRIAEFAGGNARVALAVAERVEEGESLARLSDEQLFDRLFMQRNQPNDNLRAHAEALSLVYSFSVSLPNGGDTDELAVLGSLCNIPRSKLYGSVAELLKMQIVQKRSNWRAILPHAIANRLANDALDKVPKEILRETFEASGHERLLQSFAHRLSLMHDHPIAREIVKEWLQVDGPFGKLLCQDNHGARIIEYITPIAPCTILNRIEKEINGPEFKGLNFNPYLQRTILNLIRYLSYEADKFNRCIELLLQLAETTYDTINASFVKEIIFSLFQAYLSGTHASLNQRLAVVGKTLHSKNKKRRELGFHMLSAALDGPPWSNSLMNDFGAQSRDFGLEPNYEEFVEWQHRFIDLLAELDYSGDQDLSDLARVFTAKRFRELWQHSPIQSKLIEVARTFNNRKSWIEGWKAVRDTIYHAPTEEIEGDEYMLHLDNLIALEVELAPKCLLEEIKAYVLESGYNTWSLDDEREKNSSNSEQESERRLARKSEKLGQKFADSGQPLSLLGRDLFSNNGKPFIYYFGMGLARSSLNIERVWKELVDLLHHFNIENSNISLFRGLIWVLDKSNRRLAQRFLDQCLHDRLLRKNLVLLHPPEQYNRVDFNRCIKTLNEPEVDLEQYGNLLWNDAYTNLSKECLIEVADQLLKIKGGEATVLFALSKKFRKTNPKRNNLDAKFYRIGFEAAKVMLRRNQRDRDGTVDYRMERVIEVALTYGKNEREKISWIDTIFKVVDANHGHLFGYGNTINITAKSMPKEFLKRVFLGNDEMQEKRRNFVRGRGKNRSPIEAIDIDVLIDWCRMEEKLEVWAVVASGICPWEVRIPDESIKINRDAMKFLEAAPNKEDVLVSYSDRVIPRIFTWDGGKLMRLRASAIEELGQHPNHKIALAAVTTAKKANERIENWISMRKNFKKENEHGFE